MLLSPAMAKEPSPDLQERGVRKDHADKLLNIESLQELPINTDDDFRLVLGKHLYELVYELIDNSEC